MDLKGSTGKKTAPLFFFSLTHDLPSFLSYFHPVLSFSATSLYFSLTVNLPFLQPSLTSTLLLPSSLPPTCFYITLFSMRSTLPYMSQLIGPAAQLKFTIATMIQSPSNGFYFHPTSYSGTPISPQPTVQCVNLRMSDKV